MIVATSQVVKAAPQQEAPSATAGERKLLCAVIRNAINGVKTGESLAMRFFQDADSPFWDHCAHLGLDAQEISRRVWKLRRVWVFLLALLISGSAHAQLPAAPEPRNLTKLDYSLMASQFVVRGMDFASTMDCQSHAKWMQFQTGVGASTYWKNVGCHEWELPQSFVAGRAQFAFFSFGMAAIQDVGEYELTRHGHRKIARRLALVSIGSTGITALNNFRTIGR